MTPCHACPEAAGPSGWCARHRNRLNAIVGRKIMEVAPLSDLIAVAQHPGWRGRKWRLRPGVGEYGPFFHVSDGDGYGPGYKTAAEALAELDRLNGLPAASDIDALRARLAEVERKAKQTADALDVEAKDNREMWGALNTIQAITDGRYLPEPSEVPDPNPTIGSAAVVKVARLRRRLTEVERERDDARAKLAETADLCRDLDERVTIVCSERNAYMAERDAARSEASDLRARLDRYRAAVAALVVAVVLAVVAAVGGGL